MEIGAISTVVVCPALTSTSVSLPVLTMIRFIGIDRHRPVVSSGDGQRGFGSIPFVGQILVRDFCPIGLVHKRSDPVNRHHLAQSAASIWGDDLDHDGPFPFALDATGGNPLLLRSTSPNHRQQARQREETVGLRRHLVPTQERGNEKTRKKRLFRGFRGFRGCKKDGSLLPVKRLDHPIQNPLGIL